MKKITTIALLFSMLALALTGCGSGNKTPAGAADLETIKIGATSTPHAEILNAVKDMMAEEGYNLEITEYTDYVIPNTAVESGELDVNYFQHEPYLDSFNAEKGTHIVSVAKIHYEPMGVYPGKTAKLDVISDGATIAVPNDPTNEARALFLLQQEGLITLAEGVALEATPNDIVDNPKNIKFYEVEAAAVPRSLSDVDFAIINGNYALEAGLKAEDGLAFEAADSIGAQTYANIICVKAGNENDPAVQALVQALTSDTARKFIEDKYAGSVVPVF